MKTIINENKKTNETNETFIMLTDDDLFKTTFGMPKNIKYLSDLLESYFGYKRGYLKNKLQVKYEVTLPKTKYQDKSFRSDLVVIVDNTFIVNIEMYTLFNKKALDKSKSYAMRIYSTQLEIGSDYSAIKKVTQINFVDNVKIEISDEIRSSLVIGNEQISDDFKMDIVRLDRAREIKYNKGNRFIKWLKFIGARTKEERESIAKGDEILMELNKWLEAYSNDKTLENFFDDKKWDRRIFYSQGVDDGKIEIATNLLKKGESISYIEEVTGLSKKEINKLKEELS